MRGDEQQGPAWLPNERWVQGPKRKAGWFLLAVAGALFGWAAGDAWLVVMSLAGALTMAVLAYQGRRGIIR